MRQTILSTAIIDFFFADGIRTVNEVYENSSVIEVFNIYKYALMAEAGFCLKPQMSNPV